MARPLQRQPPAPARAPPRPLRSPPESEPASAYGSAIGPAVLRAPEVARLMQRGGERPSGASDAGSDAGSWRSESKYAGTSGAATPVPGLRRTSPVQARSTSSLLSHNVHVLLPRCTFITSLSVHVHPQRSGLLKAIEAVTVSDRLPSRWRRGGGRRRRCRSRCRGRAAPASAPRRSAPRTPSGARARACRPSWRASRPQLMLAADGCRVYVV